MSLLIQMRQRIKAIETIKKITHAMRLISMSTHTRLKGKDKPLHDYNKKIKILFHKVQASQPEWSSHILHPTTEKPTPLIILVGSQKGLCGNFNTALFRIFEKAVKQHKSNNLHLIAIGKKAADYLKTKKVGNIITAHDEFTSNNLLVIADHITNEIIRSERRYTTVNIVSNKLRTFFLQKPYKTEIIPCEERKKKSTAREAVEDYTWEQSPEEVLDFLARQTIEADIQYLLYQSLLAEQAARFLSMDSATRNAKNILETTQLQYNKLRQAKITKELTELTGSL